MPQRASADAPEFSAANDRSVSRYRRPSFVNARFFVGASIVVACTLLGALLLATPSRQQVWAARHALPPGAILRGGDLEAQPVAGPRGYVPATTSIVGKRLTRPVGAAELVPASALGPAVYGDFRSIAIPVEAEHSPPSLAAGHYVDVWVTPRDAAGSYGLPFLALAAVPVSAITRDSIGGATAAATVVVDVKPGQARDLITGLRRGVIDLVRVPGAIQ